MIVIFRPHAVEDVIEAAAWYEAHAPGLGEQLIDEILTATHRAQENPELFAIVRREGNVRRVLTKRFPYRDLFLGGRRDALRSRSSSRSAPRSSVDEAIVTGS